MISDHDDDGYVYDHDDGDNDDSNYQDRFRR